MLSSNVLSFTLEYNFFILKSTIFNNAAIVLSFCVCVNLVSYISFTKSMKRVFSFFRNSSGCEPLSTLMMSPVITVVEILYKHIG